MNGERCASGDPFDRPRALARAAAIASRARREPSDSESDAATMPCNYAAQLLKDHWPIQSIVRCGSNIRRPAGRWKTCAMRHGKRDASRLKTCVMRCRVSRRPQHELPPFINQSSHLQIPADSVIFFADL